MLQFVGSGLNMKPQLSQNEVDLLLAAAHEAREMAYAPYSKFQVGAALLLKNGTIVKGANIENASYGLAICAERVAVTTAMVSGERDFVAMAVVSPSSPPGAPCGACRQVLSEFAPELPLLLANEKGDVTHTSLKEIFPAQFNREQLLSHAS
jgi:cytidine deaminase